jgi:hypothetical protein
VLVRLRTYEKSWSRRLLCRRSRTNVRVAGPGLLVSKRPQPIRATDNDEDGLAQDLEARKNPSV